MFYWALINYIPRWFSINTPNWLDHWRACFLQCAILGTVSLLSPFACFQALISRKTIWGERASKPKQHGDWGACSAISFLLRVTKTRGGGAGLNKRKWFFPFCAYVQKQNSGKEDSLGVRNKLVNVNWQQIPKLKNELPISNVDYIRGEFRGWSLPLKEHWVITELYFHKQRLPMRRTCQRNTAKPLPFMRSLGPILSESILV